MESHDRADRAAAGAHAASTSNGSCHGEGGATTLHGEPVQEDATARPAKRLRADAEGAGSSSNRILWPPVIADEAAGLDESKVKAVPEPPDDFAAAMCATWSALCALSSSSDVALGHEQLRDGACAVEEAQPLLQPSGASGKLHQTDDSPQGNGSREQDGSSGSAEATAAEHEAATEVPLPAHQPPPAEQLQQQGNDAMALDPTRQAGLCVALPPGAFDALGGPGGFHSCSEPPPVLAELAFALRSELPAAGEERSCCR